MKRWREPAGAELEIARETPEDMPPLTYQLQRAAHDIATLPPRDFRAAFPELHYLAGKKARYRDRRIAFARVLEVAPIHIDHEFQFLQYATKKIAEEAGIRERRAELAIEDITRAGYWRSSKQRKIAYTDPKDPRKKRHRGCAVRRYCEPLFYHRLGVNIEADREKKRRETARADAAEKDRIALEQQKISELLRMPHIKTAPTAPAVPVIDDAAKNAGVRRAEEGLRVLRERWAAADRDDEPPE